MLGAVGGAQRRGRSGRVRAITDADARHAGIRLALCDAVGKDRTQRHLDGARLRGERRQAGRRDRRDADQSESREHATGRRERGDDRGRRPGRDEAGRLHEPYGAAGQPAGRARADADRGGDSSGSAAGPLGRIAGVRSGGVVGRVTTGAAGQHRRCVSGIHPAGRAPDHRASVGGQSVGAGPRRGDRPGPLAPPGRAAQGRGRAPIRASGGHLQVRSGAAGF